MTPSEIANLIDHTLLRPDAVAFEIERLCDEAIEHRFMSVCVQPSFVPLAAARLSQSSVRTCTVAGFPLGTNRTAVKVHEARLAIDDGAREVDMVLAIGALKQGDTKTVLHDIGQVVDACHESKALCKVIFETCLLTDQEKELACAICADAGADFVKTSTGFSKGGATVADVALMSRLVKNKGLGVKAAGGIRSLAALAEMVKAGATRIGTSSGVGILREAAGQP